MNLPTSIHWTTVVDKHRQYTPTIHPFILTRQILKDDYDSQMIFRDLVGLHLPDTVIGEGKKKKNTQEICPD